MEDRRSDLKLGPRSRRESGEASAAGGKGKKNRTPSLVLGNDEREAATGTDITSAWTGEKKTKIQNTPTSEDIGKDAKDDAEHSSAMVVQEQEQEPEQIEGLDWDQDKLNKKIDYFLKQLNGDIADNDDDDFWVLCDDNQRRELNERLALCRIRAHEVEHRELDDSDLKSIYPANVLEDQCYYEFYERDFDWYFDPQYCKYVHLEDYQRLMLRNNGEYEGWEDYREICSTHEGDKDFVELWEKLLSNTKLIEFFLTDSSYKPLKIEKVVFYHWLKIAARLSHVFNALIYSGFHEFVWSVRFDNTWYKYYTGLFVDIWKRVAKQKMNFKEALKEVYDEEKYTVCRFEWKHEFESNGLNPGPMECLYNRHLGHIDEKAEEGRAYQLIMEAVKKFVPKQKTYYDYAKKKLAIAKEIRLTRDPYKRVIGHKAGLAGGYYQVKDRKLLAIEVGV